MNYQELTDIRDAAIRLHLDGSTFLAYLPIDVLAAAYNGTGPEFLPQRIRDLLDGACRPVLPSVASTVDFRDLCQGLLDMLPVPNDEK